MNINCYFKNLSAAAQIRINRACVEDLVVTVAAEINGLHDNVDTYMRELCVCFHSAFPVMTFLAGALNFKRCFNGSNLYVGVQ